MKNQSTLKALLRPLLLVSSFSMMLGCASTRPLEKESIQREEQITEEAIERAYAKLKEMHPEIDWSKPEEVFLQYILPDGYHRGVGWFWHGNKRVHAYVVGTGHLVFTDGYFDAIAEHEAIHLIANGSGARAALASQNHEPWLFHQGVEVRW